METDRQSPAPLAFGHIALTVSDIESSVRFYCGVLGATMMQAPHDSYDNPDFRGRKAVLLLGDGYGFNLNEHRPDSGDRFDPGRVGIDHLAFAAGSYEALEAWASHLDAHGVPHSPVRDAGGVASMFDFLDPDGIQLEFFFFDPGRLSRSATQAETTSA